VCGVPFAPTLGPKPFTYTSEGFILGGWVNSCQADTYSLIQIEITWRIVASQVATCLSYFAVCFTQSKTQVCGYMATLPRRYNSISRESPFVLYVICIEPLEKTITVLGPAGLCNVGSNVRRFYIQDSKADRMCFFGRLHAQL
jgi:hypothetical protein